MLAYLLTSSDLGSLLGLVSGDFFKVVPVGDLTAIASRLRRNAGDADAFTRARRTLSEDAAAGGLPVALEALPPGATRSPLAREHAARAALELFFFQVLAEGTWLLDLRANAFDASNEGIVSWTPRPYWWAPSDAFQRGVRALYTGFYTGDDTLFRSALASLGLAAAEAPLREHFGLGDQSAVRFELTTFQATFARVFRACRAAGSPIAPEFAVLGIALLTLYEHLEKHGGTFDVRAAFLRAERAALASAREKAKP